MAKFDEGEPYGKCALGGHKCAACFGFRGRGHAVLDSVAHDVYGCVVHCVGVFGGDVDEDVTGGGAGTCFC